MTSFLAPDLFLPSPSAWPFGALRPRAYGLIMADPPWRFELYSDKGEAKSPQAHYGTMSLAEIAALPVADLAAEDCLLWLWATAPLLPRQIEIAEAWGFTYKTSGVWVKRTVHDKLAFGTGYTFRNAHEPIVIATRGNPDTSRSVRSVIEAGTLIEARMREHSRKPDAAFEAAARLVPGVARAELFSRQRRSGWDTWGNQVDRFEMEGETA